MESEAAAQTLLVRVGNASDGTTHTAQLDHEAYVPLSVFLPALDRSVGRPLAIGNGSFIAVGELRDELFKWSGVPVQDQILLCGPPFARLDPRRAIGSYGLPSDDKQVFLYDRRLLSQENPALPSQSRLQPVEVELPTAPVSSSEGSKLLSESSSPLLRALADYESHFQLQVDQSKALEHGSLANIDACEQCVVELEVQAQAIRAAIANLDIFKTSMTKHFTPFWEDFEESSEKHQHLLANFESYLTKLSTIALHPALATDTRKTLYDCIPVEREREWSVQCQQSLAHVSAQVLRLRSVHAEVCSEVDEMVNSQQQISLEYEQSLQELAAMKTQAATQEQITAKLTENLVFAQSKIAETSMDVNPSSMMFASSSALEVCRGIDELYREQHDMLPTAQNCAAAMIKSMRKIAGAKTSFFSMVHSNLRNISISQTKIRDFENSVAMLKEAHAAQKKHFKELEHLEKLPESYAACLKEVSRRIKYGQQFSDKIQSMAEQLAQMREDEVQHREVFLRSFGQHLPRDFVPGLAEKPSHCEFRMRPFDQNLPQIEDEEESNAQDGDSNGLPNDLGAEESKFEDESDHGSNGSTSDVNMLQKRCDELEARIAELTVELDETKKKNSFYGSESGSISRSDVSKREGDSSCEFPLVLALAATTGAMTSSSEADRSNLMEQEQLLSVKRMKELENHDREKNSIIAKLESENQQFLLNAAAFEEEIQERTTREKYLQENQNRLVHSIQSLQFSIGVQRSALLRVLTLLELAIERNGQEVDVEEYVNSSMDVIERRIRELISSADASSSLRSELERRQDELSLMESEHEAEDSFKISFRSFNYNDLALFLPTSAPGSESQRVYLAFHLGCPHRFLAEESISSFSMAGKRYPDYVVGRIVLIDEQIATEVNNPYALHLGTTFYILTVASLHES